MARAPRLRTLAVAATAALAVLVPAAAAAAPAATDDVVSELVAGVRVDDDGSLRVTETQRYDFGRTPNDDLRRTLRIRVPFDADQDEVFTVTNVRASVDGRSARVSRDDTDGLAALTVDLGRPLTGRHTFRFEYDVQGAVRRTSDGLEVSWPVVQGLHSPVSSARVNLSAPAVTWAVCFAGGAGSTMPCTAAQLGESSSPVFVQQGLGPGERMTIVAGLPGASAVRPDQRLDQRWSLRTAFSLTPLTIGLLVGLVALAGCAVFALWWTRGRDTGAPKAGQKGGYRPLVADPDGRTRFAPPEGIRPGQMGTLVDERADVVDIVATVLDLAMRGLLVIEEGGRPSRHRGPQWLVHRTGTAADDLAPYERAVLDLLFDSGAREVVSLPEIAGAPSERLDAVRDQLYADVHARGWFHHRPDAVRSRWTTAGAALALVGVVLTVVLAITTDLGLVGLAVVLAGGVLAWGGDLAPSRTGKGSALLTRLRDLRRYLATADGSDLPENHRAELAARFLPYAVVFGLEDRWAETFAASGRPGAPDAGLEWFRAPEDWHRIDVPDSLDAFVAALSNAISPGRRLRI